MYLQARAKRKYAILRGGKAVWIQKKYHIYAP